MKDLKSKPEIIVFAGPNGSGKSTFAELAERQREEHVSEMRQLCFETVMSTDRNLKLL